MIGKLFIVATPIGNLEDITTRALNTLKEVDLILAEDTRVISKLLNHYDIETHIKSYHHHSLDNKKKEIALELFSGKNIALVTDAGTPGISDPGNELINYILEIEPEVKIIPIPGASALTAALSISGFRTDKFFFLGFLPKKGKENLLRDLLAQNITFCFFESVKRMSKTLQTVEKVGGGERRIIIARELTKIHEEIVRGKVSEVINKGKIKQKGEIVIVIEKKLPQQA